MIILGIDPGSRVTGYGIIQSNGMKHAYLASGTIRTQAHTFIDRLPQIFQGIQKIVHDFRPEEAAIEQVFMSQNASSALKLGQARGAAIVAMMNEGIPVAEYSARAVKQAVVGYGAAEKAQVQHMIKLILGLTGTLAADASDALAIAICHAHSRRMVSLTSKIYSQALDVVE